MSRSRWPDESPAILASDCRIGSQPNVLRTISKREPQMKTAADIDDYLARLPGDQRRALEDLRRQIHAAAPGLTEVISYGMPGFRLDGVLVWMGAAKAHCAFYPHGLVEDYADRLAGYDTSKGAIRFQPDRPPPADLVRDIVRRRLTEDLEKTAARKTRSRSKP